MRISLKWLSQYVELPAPEELARRLTAVGLEVEAVERTGAGLDGVVVARILASEKHPNAEKLSVTSVDRGDGTPLQVVCGAKNYAVGDLVPLATVGTTLPGGTILRVVEFSPGVQSRNHRTDSIDYAIIISGEIDMEMDGAMIHLKAGDVLVQRGTIHNWINTGTAPCVIAFALIDGKPVTAGGKVLNAVG
jgi:hypothetical protein